MNIVIDIIINIIIIFNNCNSIIVIENWEEGKK